ncbi:hypothetical protein [Streptomyces sp. NPDC014623]|uniref:hypothetical protein n=1 Tax=Streptomyces sp. NPDC014623 TaxID=3364875 RepID=UPI0036FC8C76
MAAETEGSCRADGTSGGLEGVKRFHGELPGWTYADSMAGVGYTLFGRFGRRGG